MAETYNQITNSIIQETAVFQEEINKSGVSSWRVGNKILREGLQVESQVAPIEGEKMAVPLVLDNDFNRAIIQDAGVGALNTFFGPTLQRRLDKIPENMQDIEQSTRLFYEQNFGAIDLYLQQRAQSEIGKATQHWNVRTSPDVIFQEIITKAIDWLNINLGTYTLEKALTEWEHRIKERFDHYLTPRAQDAMTLSFNLINQLYAANYAIQWFRYVRQVGVPPERRDFCEAHESANFGNVNFYHINEILLIWPRFNGGEWDGRLPGTDDKNIMTNRGGYGCLHVFVPIQRGEGVDIRSRNRAADQSFIPF